MQVSTTMSYVAVVVVQSEGCSIVERSDLNVYTDVEPAVMLYYSGASGLEGGCTLAALLVSSCVISHLVPLSCTCCETSYAFIG